MECVFDNVANERSASVSVYKDQCSSDASPCFCSVGVPCDSRGFVKLDTSKRTHVIMRLSSQLK